MALTQINLGSAANAGDGTTLRAGGAIINAAITQVDTNESDITANDTDISTNQSDILVLQLNPLIQYVFQDISTGDVSNSSNVTFLNTGLEVEITPSLASSEIIVSFSSNWEFTAPQNGFIVKLEYSDDNYSTSTIVNCFLIAGANTLLQRHAFFKKLKITNLNGATKARVIFATQTNGTDVTFKGTRGAFLDISEIKV